MPRCKTIEERLTRIECEVRDLKTRMTKIDENKFDPRRPEWARQPQQPKPRKEAEKEKPRRSPKNLPYPENESCLDIGCIKYGVSCCGADPTGEQCGAQYCHDRVVQEKVSEGTKHD